MFTDEANWYKFAHSNLTVCCITYIYMYMYIHMYLTDKGGLVGWSAVEPCVAGGRWLGASARDWPANEWCLLSGPLQLRVTLGNVAVAHPSRGVEASDFHLDSTKCL